MERPDDRASSGRESFLALMLAALAGGGFLLFLILVSGGFFFYVLCAVLAVFCLGFVNYLLWGRAMTREVAGEREDMELEEREDERFRRL
jgi:hypothetical protein